MAQDTTPSTETAPAPRAAPAASSPAPGTPTPSALAPKTERPEDAHHVHEIAGFQVGVNPIPFSVIMVFLFIVFIAIISWIPMYGF